jgi:hypothetical protein
MKYDLEDLHLIACEKEEHMFQDPSTGLFIMTAYYLGTIRKKCCGQECMFCPFDHENVVNKKKNKKDIQIKENKS